MKNEMNKYEKFVRNNATVCRPCQPSPVPPYIKTLFFCNEDLLREYVSLEEVVKILEIAEKSGYEFKDIPPDGFLVNVRDADNSEWAIRRSTGKISQDGYLLCYLDCDENHEPLEWQQWKPIDQSEIWVKDD